MKRLAIALAVLLIGSAAQAQPTIRLPIPLSRPPTKAAPIDPLGDFMRQIEAVKAADIAAVIADIQAADADAGTVVTPAIAATPGSPAVAATATSPAVPAVPATAAIPAQVRDPIAHACYPALIQFLQSTPNFQPTTGKLVGFQLFQRKRDFMAQLKAGLPVYLKLGCAPLLGDEINTLIQTMAIVGIKVLPAGIAAICPPCAAATAPIALPALSLTP